MKIKFILEDLTVIDTIETIIKPEKQEGCVILKNILYKIVTSVYPINPDDLELTFLVVPVSASRPPKPTRLEANFSPSPMSHRGNPVGK